MLRKSASLGTYLCQTASDDHTASRSSSRDAPGFCTVGPSSLNYLDLGWRPKTCAMLTVLTHHKNK